MLTTIDSAGRIVIPKRMRDRLGLEGGGEVEVTDLGGTIEISPRARNFPLVGTEQGLLAAPPDAGLPGRGPEDVREALERTRR